jgi:hypothetical protein
MTGWIGSTQKYLPGSTDHERPRHSRLHLVFRSVLRMGSYARWSVMTTLHRRRQWRDKRKPPTPEELARADWLIGLHCILCAFFLALLLMVVFVGQPSINAFFSFFGA